MKKIINKLIIIFLFMQPFLDVITSIQINYNIFNFYITSIIRILFMLFILIYMIVYKYDLKLILCMFIYGLIFGLYLIFNHSISLAINAIRIFYLPVMILFFNNETLKICKKHILISGLLQFKKRKDHITAVYADNLFLPFNLLEAKTFLPPGVLILLLNP